ncbi:MAG: hypothetical protein WC890_01245 [Candidatus Margulisiibacteriota bacterium]
MLIINLLVALLVPFTLGTCALSSVISRNGLRLMEKFFLAMLAGIALQVILMFILPFIKIPLTLAYILAGDLLVCLVMAIFLFFNKSFFFNRNELSQLTMPQGLTWIEISLMALMSLKFIYVFFEALIKPVIDIDAISMYSVGAKAIFIKHTFLDSFILQTIHDKPFFAYLSQAWLLISLQSFNDCLIKLFYPIIFICLLGVFYSQARRFWPRQFSLLFTFLLSSFPFMVFHATTAYVDFSQTAYYAISTIYLFLFIKEIDQKTQLTIAAHDFFTLSLVFLAFSLWIKRGGIFLAAINLVSIIMYLFIFKRKLLASQLRSFILPAGYFILLTLPWIIYSQASIFWGTLGVATQEVATQASNTAAGSNFQVVFSTLLNKLFLYSDWHLLWGMFILATLFCLWKKTTRPILFLLTIIILNIFALFFDFSLGHAFAYLLDGTLLDRLVMVSTPIVLFYCAEVFSPNPNS